jgi:ketosteroid isomerase-like protein
MKKIMMLSLMIHFLVSCQKKQPVRYTENSPEIETVRAMFYDYLAGDWEGFKAHYAPGARIYWNGLGDNYSSVEETIAGESAFVALLSSHYFVKDKEFFQMVVDDRGNVWVNFWGVWKGTLAVNEQSFEFPVHFTFRFEEGKIIEERGYADYSRLNQVLLSIEAGEFIDTETLEF